MAPLLAAGLLLQASAWRLESIQIQGAPSLPVEAVARAAGLRRGARAGKADFDAACQKLVASGLFQFCNYRYRPVAASAISLEITLQEAVAEHPVRIDVAGVEESAVWRWLEANEPMVRRTIPGSDEASRFYTGSIHRALRDLGNSTQVAAVATADAAGRIQIVFRPAHLPAVADVRFQGNVLFPEKRLRETLLPVASQSAFTEGDFRQLLDLNIRPLYEQAGRLGVRFPTVAIEKGEGGVVVTTTVVEGPVYVLKSAKLSGDLIAAAELERTARLPVGSIANWRAVLDGLDAALETLKNEGYLMARYEAGRKLDEAAGHAHLDVVFHRGEQFTFGGLQLEGLPPELEAQVRGLWRLEPGAPMREGYVDVFLRAAFQVAGKEYRSVAKQVSVHPGTHIVDITAKFSR